MNGYKKIIKSANKRKLILKMLFWVPSNIMLRIQYWIKLKRNINFKKPERYTEKIQVYKLSYKNQLVRQLIDKYEVRKHVSNWGYEDILIKNLGIYKNFEDIDFSILPEKFVIKSTNGAGANQVILVNRKEDVDLIELKNKIKKWPKKTYSRDGGREWGYGGIKTRILIEEMLPRDSHNDIPDYKFFCFDGKVFCLYVMKDYVNDKKNGRLHFFDRDFNKLKYHRNDYKPIMEDIEKPINFEKMIEIAERLSSGFPHVRVDLYNIEGKIYFGELTFYTASGFIQFEPDEFDFILGNEFINYDRRE